MNIVKYIVGLLFIVLVSNRIKSWLNFVVRSYGIVSHCSKMRKASETRLKQSRI